MIDYYTINIIILSIHIVTNISVADIIIIIINTVDIPVQLPYLTVVVQRIFAYFTHYLYIYRF